MNNEQEQNVDFDKLLGDTKDDTKIDFGGSEGENLDDFMKDEEPKVFSPFSDFADDSFVPDEVPEGFSSFGGGNVGAENNFSAEKSDFMQDDSSSQEELPSFLTRTDEEQNKFVPEETVMEFSPSIELKSDEDEDFSEEIDTVDPLKDFNDFKMDDLDSALKSFQEARQGRSGKKNATNKSEEKKEDIIYDTSLPKELSPVDDTPKDDEPQKDVIKYEEAQKDEDTYVEKQKSSMRPRAIEDKDIKLYGLSEESMDMLKWYSGNIGDKTYEISLNYMPEFLDTDKTIRVVHVNVNSAYGWNVFFDNGIFMNLHDLQIYQRRHGKMPYNSGKIVYGSKTTQFDNINRIVVYELPRYFVYKPE